MEHALVKDTQDCADHGQQTGPPGPTTTTVIPFSVTHRAGVGLELHDEAGNTKPSVRAPLDILVRLLHLLLCITF